MRALYAAPGDALDANRKSLDVQLDRTAEAVSAATLQRDPKGVVPMDLQEVQVRGHTGYAYWLRSVAAGNSAELTWREGALPATSIVDGWTGTIVALDPMAQYDDYFLRDDGERYGIDGSLAGLTSQIESARQQGTSVQVWGLVLTGVPDVNGRQIVVKRLVVLIGRATATPVPTPTPAAPAITPVVTGAEIAVSGWSPDGEWLAFWQADDAAPVQLHRAMTLSFYNMRSGQTCDCPEIRSKTTDMSPPPLTWQEDGQVVVRDGATAMRGAPCQGSFQATSDVQPPAEALSPGGSCRATTRAAQSGDTQIEVTTTFSDARSGQTVQTVAYLLPAEVQGSLGLGGEAGARLGTRQGMTASPDTYLRLVRRNPVADQATPRVLGVDDWALRKGHAYGTILVDLEEHRVVDLLPDRSPDTLEKWLKEHPGVEVISRDRADAYADGSSRGAPEAIQVADRFHLLQNLREALERLLDRNQAALQATTKLETPTDVCSNVPEPEAPATDTEELSCTGPIVPSTGPESAATPSEQARDRRRVRRHARYVQVMALRQQGMGIRTIASQLGMSPRTVRRFIRADGFPERAQRQSAGSILDSCVAYLHQQMAAGRDNGMQLWREVRDQGYPGSRVLVSRWVAQHRHLCPESEEPGVARRRRGHPPSPPHPKPAPRPLSARQGSWLLVTQPKRLTDEERMKVNRLCQASSDVASGYELGQGFAQMVRQREVDSLDAWLSKAKGSGLPDFARFAAGIERGHLAVAAALSLPWSNGQTEGQVNRLKLVKRQMYGRASFDLLRLRVLAA